MSEKPEDCEPERQQFLAGIFLSIALNQKIHPEAMRARIKVISSVNLSAPAELLPLAMVWLHVHAFREMKQELTLKVILNSFEMHRAYFQN